MKHIAAQMSRNIVKPGQNEQIDLRITGSASSAGDEKRMEHAERCCGARREAAFPEM